MPQANMMFSIQLPSQDGKTKGSVSIGRFLSDTVASVPHFTKDDFERLLADSSQVGPGEQLCVSVHPS